LVTAGLVSLTGYAADFPARLPYKHTFRLTVRGSARGRCFHDLIRRRGASGSASARIIHPDAPIAGSLTPNVTPSAHTSS